VYFKVYGTSNYFGDKKEVTPVFRRDVLKVLQCDKRTFNDLVSKLLHEEVKTTNTRKHNLDRPLVNLNSLDSGLLNDHNRSIYSTYLMSRANRTYQKSNKWPAPSKWYTGNEEVGLVDGLLGLCQLSNIIRFYYPYPEAIDSHEFQSALQDAIREAIGNKKRIKQGYYKALIRVASCLHDRHTSLNVNNRYSLVTLIYGNSYPRVGLKMVGGYLIVNYLDISPQKGLKTGDTVLAVNGIDIGKTVYDKGLVGYSSDTFKQRDYLLTNILRGWYNELKVLKIKRDDTVFTSVVKCVTTRNHSRLKAPESLAPSFAWINDSTVYVQASLSRRDLRDIKREGYTNLVIDCRVYPNVTCWDLLRTLNHKGRIMYRYGYIKQPYQVLNFKVRYRYLPKNPFKRRVTPRIYVLQDHNTVSFGESFLMSLRYGCLDNIAFYGGNSAGALGAVKCFRLPGGVIFTTTVERQTSIHGEVFQQKGLRPDYVMDFEGLRPPEIWELIVDTSR
jgi:C-terminal processing protease CtpA/Prc